MNCGLVWLDADDVCVACGGPTRRAEIVHGNVVGWHDLCFQKLIVRWHREASAARPDLFAPLESA